MLTSSFGVGYPSLHMEALDGGSMSLPCCRVPWIKKPRTSSKHKLGRTIVHCNFFSQLIFILARWSLKPLFWRKRPFYYNEELLIDDLFNFYFFAERDWTRCLTRPQNFTWKPWFQLLVHRKKVSGQRHAIFFYWVLIFKPLRVFRVNKKSTRAFILKLIGILRYCHPAVPLV